MRTPPTSNGAVCTGELTPRPDEDQIRIAAASSTVPAPMVPMSIRSKSLFSSGRSTRSMTRPTAPVTAMAGGPAPPNGRPGRQVEGGRHVRADHQYRAMGEVDQAHGAVDQREAQRDEGVDRPEAQAADERLEEGLHCFVVSVRAGYELAGLMTPLLMVPMAVAKMPTPELS